MKSNNNKKIFTVDRRNFIERNVLLICPGFFSNFGRWKGISVRELLREAEAEPGVTRVSFRGPEGRYTKEESFSIDKINSDKVYLAYQVKGQALPKSTDSRSGLWQRITTAASG